MIIHFYTDFVATDPDTIRCNEIAKKSWIRQQWVDKPIQDSVLPRLWVERGKRLPLIQDLFDAAASAASDDDILVYTNADIVVRQNACSIIEEKMQNVDACCGRRVDVPKMKDLVEDSAFDSKTVGLGTDVFSFRHSWWRKYREEMSGFIVGIGWWDWVLRYLIEETHKGRDTELRGLLLHEKSGPAWWEQNKKCFAQMQNTSLTHHFLRRRRAKPRRFVRDYRVKAELFLERV